MTAPQLPAIVTLAERLAADRGPDGPAFSLSSGDLNVNLVRFDAGRGVPEHVNAELDVLLLGIAGQGVLEIEGVARPFGAGQLCLVPLGARRAIRSAGGPFAYLTCHRRRGGLMPV
ncbi:MAG TPA: cupin domain-containing protein [Dehalococcoidia bacterium]|nr:cupin domain-containing protein [Dehalococcoidia bacterium]